MIYEFKELIPVETPLGKGYAVLIECGRHDYYWTVVLNNRAIVTFKQDKIRFDKSYSYGRGVTDKQMKKVLK